MSRLTCNTSFLLSQARLFAACLSSTFLLAAVPAALTGRTSDEFLNGYVTSILERDLGWEKNSYTLQIVHGVATITLMADDPSRREAAEDQLRAIDGLQQVDIVVENAEADKPVEARRSMWMIGEDGAFPVGDLFQPLIADPKQPQFFVSFNRFGSLDKQYTMASVGFGETFGLYRFFGRAREDGLQLSLEGALFAQFNMSTPSSDLLNADYTIGIPATYRHGDHSFRFRIYHQSSHLGDELLLSVKPPQRVNLSYESLEFIYSFEWREWRAYGGGEYLVHKDPADLKPASAHWGVEYRGSRTLLGNARLIAGLDMKRMEAHDWDTDISLKAGLEFGHPNPGQRRLRLLAEWFKGLDPHGQFYNNPVEYYGMGIALGF